MEPFSSSNIGNNAREKRRAEKCLSIRHVIEVIRLLDDSPSFIPLKRAEIFENSLTFSSRPINNFFYFSFLLLCGIARASKEKYAKYRRLILLYFSAVQKQSIRKISLKSRSRHEEKNEGDQKSLRCFARGTANSRPLIVVAAVISARIAAK